MHAEVRPVREGRAARRSLRAGALLLAASLGLPGALARGVHAGDAAAASPLAPLRPERWSLSAAQHLLGRAGFGSTLEHAARLSLLSPTEAVDRVLAGWGPSPGAALVPDLAPVPRPDAATLAGLSREERQKRQAAVRRADAAQMERVREAWLERMITTPHPLEERMTLFWHGWFTSAFRTVRDSAQMHAQNTLLRRHALGSYATLLREVTRDPAMLRYLDGERNVVGRPNENYAREVMELFTLGVGAYSEQDVQEAARALTGWRVRGSEARLVPRLHDAGSKTVLGRTGPLDDEDLCDILLAHPATARRLARGLAVAFLHPAPDDDVVEALAQRLRATGYELRTVLRELLSSEAFYAPPARAALVKGPVDLVVGLHRALEAAPGPTPLAPWTRALGQDLFDPPSVKGWDGGEAWISTSLLLSRYSAAAALVGSAEARRTFAAALGRARTVQGMGALVDAPAELRAWHVHDAQGAVRHYAQRLLVVPLDPARLDGLVAGLGGPGALDLEAAPTRERLGTMLELLVASPEFQLR